MQFARSLFQGLVFFTLLMYLLIISIPGELEIISRPSGRRAAKIHYNWSESHYYHFSDIPETLYHSPSSLTLFNRNIRILSTVYWWKTVKNSYCPNLRCEQSHFYPDVIIHECKYLPSTERDPTKLYINICHEPWGLYNEHIREDIPKNIFSAFYRMDSDIPLTMNEIQKGKTIKQMMKEYMEEIDMSSKNSYTEPFGYGKAPICYVSSNCKTPAGRNEYVQELTKYIPVDSYGGCLKNRNNPPWPTDTNWEIDIKKQYKFCIAMSSAIVEDYISEKYFRAIEAGCVPIVNGPRRMYEKVMPGFNSTIFVEEFKDEMELAKYLHHLDQNEAEYLKYFAWRKSGLLGSWMKTWQLSSSTWSCRMCDFVTEKFSDLLSTPRKQLP
jgi:hypothetical protein